MRTIAKATTATAVLYLRVSTTRQATKNGEAEGYSIPAQRAACMRKAKELGAEVIEEFVDAGASARSADRPGLQNMLQRVRTGGVQYVIVHKVDRLARSRIDDAEIATVMHMAGSTLVSASEQIDDTPAGTLLHGIMAVISEHYSKNLSNEAKKGMAEKVRRGGTNGVAPLGYLNHIERSDGLEIRTVVVDEERAPHVVWAYKQYATGEWSIAELCEALAQRGFKSRTTRKHVGKPINNSQLHRLLTNPYYKGQIRFNEVLYEGSHQPIVDEITWQQVQDLLNDRRIAGDRSWRHSHYLKGPTICARCRGRMGYGTSRGRGGEYEYFFCIGRHTGRTKCDLPYLPAWDVEDKVALEWRRVQFGEDELQLIAAMAQAEISQAEASGIHLYETQQPRLNELERRRQKLLDAYMADALPIDFLKEEQAKVAVEMADAKRLISQASESVDRAQKHLDQVIDLLTDACKLYQRLGANGRSALNAVVFDYFELDSVVDDDGDASVKITGAPLSDVVAAVLSSETADVPQGPEIETPAELSFDGGSNLSNLAEAEGFEPSMGL